MQRELAAEQDRQRQLQQDLCAVEEASLLSDDILDSNSGALQVVPILCRKLRNACKSCLFLHMAI